VLNPAVYIFVYMMQIPDKIPGRICSLAKAYRAVAVEKLLKERAAGQPHPHASINTPVCIQ
jgi:hypothetical protein